MNHDDANTNTTRAAALDRLTPENAVFLPIDYMHGLISAARSIDPGELRNNAVALAKVARLFGLPAVGTGDAVGRTRRRATRRPSGPYLSRFPDLSDSLYPGGGCK